MTSTAKKLALTLYIIKLQLPEQEEKKYLATVVLCFGSPDYLEPGNQP